jgi:hypothetical protein
MEVMALHIVYYKLMQGRQEYQFFPEFLVYIRIVLA